MSADGRYVAFSSDAPNLVSGLEIVPSVQNVYRLDRVTGEIVLVSISTAGNGSGNSYSESPVISANGSVVAFRSSASNLHPLDSNGSDDVFARNLVTGTTYLVSVNKDGNGSGGLSSNPVINGDGTIVAFNSSATNLHSLDLNTHEDVFARNLVTGTTYLVSVNTSGNGSGNSESDSPVISADGSVIAFRSSASDLHPLDSNTTGDVFARNLVTQTTDLVSVNKDGNGSGNSFSYNPVISANGNIVAFLSSASNLHVLDSHAILDVFARNLATGTTHLVSVNKDGTGSGNSESLNPVISADGSVVAFDSDANDLHALDSDVWTDVFARNLVTQITYLVSVNKDGNGSGNHVSENPVISADGKVVAFESSAGNLQALDANSRAVYVRNLVTETTYMVSVNKDGNGSGNSSASDPVVSADGNVVAFRSYATNIIDGDFNAKYDVFVRDMLNGTSQVASKAHPSSPSGSPGGTSTINPYAVSANGRFVAFVSNAVNLVSGLQIAPNITNVYRFDRLTGQVVLISVNKDGTGSGNSSSSNPVISADGNVVVFQSSASDLHISDTNLYEDVFARNVATGGTYLVSVNRDGTGGGNDQSFNPVISADGNVVAFSSRASNLHALDSNTIEDVFVRNLATGTTHLVTVDKNGTGSGNNDSSNPMISADGNVVAFHSRSSNLHSLDSNMIEDVFARNLVTGATFLLSVNKDGTGGGNGNSSNPVISADGTVVAFSSFASNLHPLDLSTAEDVFARNLVTGMTELVSINVFGGASQNSSNPVISADGSVVAFRSTSNFLHDSDSNGGVDVFARNLIAQTTHLVSIKKDGAGLEFYASENPSISADGSVVAFRSSGRNLHALDTDSTYDVFARNLVTGTTYLVSTNAAGTGNGNNASGIPVISADGNVVAFHSAASNLVHDDLNSFTDVFVAVVLPTTVTGDYNLNGTVDTADYVVWRKTLGTTGVAPFSGADGNGDGTIDEDDYAVWRSHFGQTLPGAGVAAASPVEASGGTAALKLSGGQSLFPSAAAEDAEQPSEAEEVVVLSTAGQASSGTPAVDLLAASSPRRDAHSVRPRQVAANTSRAAVTHDDALVAWLASRAIDASLPGDGALGPVVNNESADCSNESFCDAVDAVLARVLAAI